MRTLLALGVAAALAVPLAAQQPQPPNDIRPTGDDLDVRVQGCVTGMTLSETSLRGTSTDEGDYEPVRRWRLKLTSEQKEQLKAIGRHEVEIFGVADRRETRRADLGASTRLGPGRLSVSRGSTREDARRTGSPAPLPTLIVEKIVGSFDLCR